MADDPIGAALRNLVVIRRLSNGLARDVRDEIRKLVDAYVIELARIDPTAVTRDRYRKARVAALLKRVEEISATQYPQIRRLLDSTAARVGVQQAQWAQQSLETAIGQVGVTSVSRLGVSYFREILKSDPFDGETMGKWVQRHRQSTINAVRQQIQLGVTQSEPLGDIVRRVRGRSVGGGRFKGGVLQTATRQAEGIARTAITYMANRAHMAAYQENEDVLSGVEFTATLDSRTTPICARWDGTVWALDDPRIQTPPLHFNCRSVLVPVVNWKGLGIEPPPEGKRVQGDGKPVPSSKTYADWFRDKSDTPKGRAEQDAIIGKARAELFRKGELTFRQMISRDNRVLTLDELGR